MKTPPFLLGATLLLWGWQTGLWWLAVPLAGLLESSRVSTLRWEIAQADLNRLWNLCAAALGACALYLIASEDNGLGVGGWIARGERPGAESARGAEAFRRMIQWFPLCTAPMMLAQAWGRSDSMGIATFSWYLQRRKPPETRTVNLSWSYLASVVAGSAATDLRPGLVSVLILLAGWTFWIQRSRSASTAVWFGAFALVAGMTWVGDRAIPPAVTWMRDAESLLLNRLFERRTDAMESRTSIGSLGVTKGSGAVAFRMESVRGSVLPELLREAVFQTYKNTVWQNPPGGEFKDHGPANAEGAHVFNRATETRERPFTLWLPAASRRLIPHPQGLRRLEQVIAEGLETNGLGAIRASGLGFGSLTVIQGSKARPDPDPTPADLEVPESEEAVLDEVAKDLGIAPALDPEEAQRRVARFFAERFAYTLYRGTPPRTRHTNSTLASFLLSDRRGHCEYFATATTLLLRKAGIPARYVTGWSVPDPEPGSTWTLVRYRHAHAWTVARIGGTWREIDNTPPSWVAVEQQRKHWWEGVGDAWQRSVFEWNRFRYGASGWRRWLFVPVTLLMAWLLFQLLRRRGWRPGNAADPKDGAHRAPGLDSEFFEVIRKLERAGHPRLPGETLAHWVERLHRSQPELAEPLRPLLSRHYRLRFDPAGLPPEERRSLREAAGEWLRSHSRTRRR